MLINRILKDKIIQKSTLVLLIASISVVALIGIGLAVKSVPLFESTSVVSLLTQKVWSPMKGFFGFLSFITGTLSVTLIAVLVAAPLCILTAVYLTEYAGKSLRNMMLPLVNVLAAIPPVLYGVWGVLFIVPAVQNYIAPIFGVTTSGYTVLSGGLVLAVMIFPIMISIMVEVLQTIPYELKSASMSLGATKWETIQKVVLIKAKPGIFAATVLAVSRAFGETVAVLMVCGNVPKIPTSIFDAGYPIPALIANNFGEMMSIPLYDSALMFAALLLFVIIFGFNLLSRLILNKLEGKYNG